MNYSQEIERVDAVLANIERLPPLPQSVQRVNELIDDESSTIDMVAFALADDQALSAKVLQLVNSSFYGFSEVISSITHAVVMLGVNAVRTLVSSSWLYGMMQNSSSGFHHHALACSRACFLISRSLGIDEPEEMVTVGLLHDIGKVMMAEFLLFDFVAVRAVVEEKNVLFYEAEMEVLGITHAQIGARLLENWNLPENTVVPIRHHHDSALPDEYVERTAIVRLADILIRAEGFGYAGDDRMPPFLPEILDVLAIGIEDLRLLSNELGDHMRDIPRHIGVFRS